MRPNRLRYMCRAPVDSSSADHCTTSSAEPTRLESGSSVKYFTSRMREVLSARSKSVPSCENCHDSSRLSVAPETPSTWWLERLTRSRKKCGAPMIALSLKRLNRKGSTASGASGPRGMNEGSPMLVPGLLGWNLRSPVAVSYCTTDPNPIAP